MVNRRPNATISKDVCDTEAVRESLRVYIIQTLDDRFRRGADPIIRYENHEMSRQHRCLQLLKSRANTIYISHRHYRMHFILSHNVSKREYGFYHHWLWSCCLCPSLLSK